MTDNANDSEAASEADNLVKLAEYRQQRWTPVVTFKRRELDRILRLYGFMVGAGEWRDYAIDHLKDHAIFSVYRRSSEAPLVQIIKTPKLARKQGEYSVVTSAGVTLKRGPDLERVLRVFDKKLGIVRA